jgi:hypothetical protein
MIYYMCLKGAYRIYAEEDMSHVQCCVRKMLTLGIQMRVKYLCERRFGWTMNSQIIVYLSLNKKLFNIN